jgi:hypothetical protein
VAACIQDCATQQKQQQLVLVDSARCLRQPLNQQAGLLQCCFLHSACQSYKLFIRLSCYSPSTLFKPNLFTQCQHHCRALQKGDGCPSAQQITSAVCKAYSLSSNCNTRLPFAGQQCGSPTPSPSPAAKPPQPSPSPSPVVAAGCPEGWLPAVGTIYDRCAFLQPTIYKQNDTISRVDECGKRCEHAYAHITSTVHPRVALLSTCVK